VLEYLYKNKECLLIVEKTKNFLRGFYSSFGLELLSTVDYITQKNNTNDIIKITEGLKNWSNRKKTLFTNSKFITIALKRIEQINKEY